MMKKYKSVEPKNMKVNKFEDAPLLLKSTSAGVAGCTADLVTYPLDMAKVRLQLQGESSSGAGALRYKGVFHTITTIIKEEGTRSLYNGLTAGVQRQMCFSSIRIGLYDTVKTYYQKSIQGNNPSRSLDIAIRICAGVTTGALSVIFAQPTDVVKIRFQGAQLGEQRYKSTTEAYKTIYREEGFSGLWKGTTPNIMRNAIVNVAEIVCYDLVKENILRHGWLPDNTLCHFTSGIIAGFFTTVVSSPVDVIKTRYMNSVPGQYKNPFHSAIKTAQNEGFLAFYKGFVPSFYRLVAWNIVMWVTYEKLKILVVKAYNTTS